MSDERSPRYLPVDRSQNVLIPLDVDRLIDDDHVARRIWRVVDSLELARCGNRWKRDQKRSLRCSSGLSSNEASKPPEDCICAEEERRFPRPLQRERASG